MSSILKNSNNNKILLKSNGGLYNFNSLIALANATTGEDDETLSDAINTLIAGYGQGGSGIYEAYTEGTLKAFCNTNNIIYLNDDKINRAYSSMLDSATTIKKIKLINLTAYNNYAFRNMTNLITVDLKKCKGTNSTGTDNNVYSGDTKLKYIREGASTFINGYNKFSNTTSLVAYNLFNATSLTNITGISAQSGLKLLILGKKSVVTMSNTTDINASSPIATGTGYVYVPDLDSSGNDLPALYKVATNWSNFSNSIRGYSEAPAYVSGNTYSIGDFVQLNSKVYAYWDYNNTTNAPSGTTDDTDYWHYVGECQTSS